MRPNAIRRILVPFDFSECSKSALDYAGFLARKFGATVEIVHVLEPLPERFSTGLIVADPPETMVEHAWRIAKEETERIADGLSTQGVGMTWKVEMGTAWEKIVALAPTADLVVMGTHGRTGISRFLMGSVTDKVVQRSPTPVLTIRGAERTEATETVAEPVSRPVLRPVS